MTELARMTVSLAVVVRPCRPEDLPALEWGGLFREHRPLMERVFAEQQRGEALMLVAEANGAVGGQLWIDWVSQRAARRGVLWAVRVVPCLQNLGIGARLLAVAEAGLRARRFAEAEVSVELENVRAQQFYQRHGYGCIGEATPAVFRDPVTPPHPQLILRKGLFTAKNAKSTKKSPASSSPLRSVPVPAALKETNHG